jgi:uncharacterized iron-regulated membrane protein
MGPVRGNYPQVSSDHCHMSTAAPPSAPPSSPPLLRSAPSFAPLLLRLHFYAGILVAPFLLVAALTGTAFVFSPQLDRIVYADELVVDDPGGASAPLSAQVAAALAVRPGGTVTAVRPGEGSRTTHVDFAAPDVDADHAHTVYVNPYTTEVTGQLTTWFTSTPLQEWLDTFHRDLHLGPSGTLYSELAASWLSVIALGGLLLWWRRHRGRRTARRLLAPDLTAKKGVRRTRGFHAATGAWLAIGLLFLSATGLTWSDRAGANFSAALDSLRSGTPTVSTGLAEAAPGGSGHHSSGGSPAGAVPADPGAIDGVVRTARDNGIDGPIAVTVPADGRTAWTVAQTRNLWPVGRDTVAVDAATSTVTDRVDFADFPVLAKLTTWGIQAHMGYLFGLVNQILLAALAIGLVCVIVWGYRMWWQRRPTRADRRALTGAPLGVRGAWQQLPSWAIVVGVPVVIALGWVMPLLGIPLAAFLVLDLAVGAFRGRVLSAR